MEFNLPILRKEEKIALHLRALYEESGYSMLRMGSFEEYDLYMQNRPFLTEEDIITFTASDGRLMALRPDITLSLVKNTLPGAKRKVYYNENVFRRHRQTGEYLEIQQMGLECIGGDEQKAEEEVLALAAKSLAVSAGTGGGKLDLSHMAFLEAVLALFGSDDTRALAIGALKTKSPHAMLFAAQKAGLSQGMQNNMCQLAQLSGPFSATIAIAEKLAKGIPGAAAPLQKLKKLYAQLKNLQSNITIRLDFSIVNDVDYYNGVVFQGYCSGVAKPVLAGGRYNNLLRRFYKPQGAIGFALFLNELAKTGKNTAPSVSMAGATASPVWLNVALPKGRLGNAVYHLFEKAGFASKKILQESRKLIMEDEKTQTRFFLAKPSDVDIYVEHGAADIGALGKDILMESGADVLELLDLCLGKCTIAVAGPAQYKENSTRPLRVATKYPCITRSYYAGQSRAVEIIKLHGSIELAPLLGLSDVIVDIVETGKTLKENKLTVLASISPSSARIIANRAAWRFKEERIKTLLERLRDIIC